MNISESIKFIEDWAKTAKSIDTYEEGDSFKSETLIDFEELYGKDGFEVKGEDSDWDCSYKAYSFVRNTSEGKVSFWYFMSEDDFELSEIESVLKPDECTNLLNATINAIKHSN